MLRIAFVTFASASKPLSLRSSALANAIPRVRRLKEPLARSCSSAVISPGAGTSAF
jgi:hypothetical protein